MRWRAVRAGELRTVRHFLWFPMHDPAAKTWRWLEWARIIQRYVVDDEGGFWFFDHFAPDEDDKEAA